MSTTFFKERKKTWKAFYEFTVRGGKGFVLMVNCVSGKRAQLSMKSCMGDSVLYQHYMWFMSSSLMCNVVDIICRFLSFIWNSIRRNVGLDTCFFDFSNIKCIKSDSFSKSGLLSVQTSVFQVHFMSYAIFWHELCSLAGIAVLLIAGVLFPFSCNSSAAWKLVGIQPGRKPQAHLCSDKSVWWKWKWF